MVPRTRKLVIGGVVAVALAAAAVIGVFSLRAAVRASLDAESRFHAAIIVHGAVVRFESEHGRRPASWDDLRPMTPLAWGGFELPRDIDPVQRWVTTDFGSLPDAARVTDAIHPTGATYSGWEDLLPDGVGRGQ